MTGRSGGILQKLKLMKLDICWYYSRTGKISRNVESGECANPLPRGPDENERRPLAQEASRQKLSTICACFGGIMQYKSREAAKNILAVRLRLLFNYWGSERQLGSERMGGPPGFKQEEGCWKAVWWASWVWPKSVLRSPWVPKARFNDEAWKA